MRALIALPCTLLVACAGADAIDTWVDPACVDGTDPATCHEESWSLADDGEVIAGDDAIELKAGDDTVTVGPPTRREPIAFATDMTEAGHALRIRDERRHRPKAIFSVRLDGLSPAERVKVIGEVQVSFCDDKDRRGDSSDAATTPCTSAHMVSAPYHYTPRLSAAFVLSDDRQPSGRRVSSWRETSCGKEKHHCTVTLPRVTLTDLPAGRRWLHLVLTADGQGANAKSWHVMEIEQGKGRLSVARLGPDAEAVRDTETKRLLSTGRLGVDQTPDEGDHTQVQRMVYRQELRGLQAGDVIAANGRMHATLGRFDCDPLISTQLLLTDRAGVREPEDAVQRLTAKNGFNCRAHGSGECVYDKAGAVRLKETPRGPLYVTWVAMAKRSCAAPNGGDHWEMKRDVGQLAVQVYR